MWNRAGYPETSVSLSLSLSLGFNSALIISVIDRSLSLRPGVDTVFEEIQEIDAIVTIAEVQLFSGAWTWTQKLAKVLSLPTSKNDVLRKQCELCPTT